MYLKSGDRFLGFEYNPLSCATVVDQVTSDDGHGSVCEPDRHLRKVIDGSKGRNLYYNQHVAHEFMVDLKRTGNCLLAFCTETVDRHRGPPSFFSVSSAQTFNTGSLERSSDTETSRAVPCICRRCVTEPVSWALNDRTIRKAEETMWTKPSVVPTKRFAEPVQMLEKSF